MRLLKITLFSFGISIFHGLGTPWSYIFENISGIEAYHKYEKIYFLLNLQNGSLRKPQILIEYNFVI